MINLSRNILDYLKVKVSTSADLDEQVKNIVQEATNLLDIFADLDLALDRNQISELAFNKIKAALAEILLSCLELCTILEINAEELLKDSAGHSRANSISVNPRTKKMEKLPFKVSL